MVRSTQTAEGRRFPLVCADAAVPYRTSCLVAKRYDSDAVCAALEQDIVLNGAPLAYRLDRAKQHRTEEVSALLERHQVLAFHGPPRHPRFYGQLERQNREHRAWLGSTTLLNEADVSQEAGRMFHAFNRLLPKHSLGWRTAAAAWDCRQQLEIDRNALREEVTEEAGKLAAGQRIGWSFAWRRAIEVVFTRRGWLAVKPGGRC